LPRSGLTSSDGCRWLALAGTPSLAATLAASCFGRLQRSCLAVQIQHTGDSLTGCAAAGLARYKFSARLA
jgi:hypothetical protein